MKGGMCEVMREGGGEEAYDGLEEGMEGVVEVDIDRRVVT